MSHECDTKEQVPVKGTAVSSNAIKSEPMDSNLETDVGSSSLYLDPKKEASMMRKFDVSENECLGQNAAQT